MLVEGWLPEGISQNDLHDGDFAWLSDKYRAASAAERKEMNKREHRKLPFKIHGKVNRAGWKAAWNAAAHPGGRHPSFAGGPSQEEVLNKLRRNKPSGIEINKDNTFTDNQEALDEPIVLMHGSAKFEIMEEATDDGFKVRGVALIDDAISSNGNYYSRAFNDKCMENTNRRITVDGLPVTVYARHGQAMGQRGSLPTALPIGRVFEELWRDKNEIWYEMFIAATDDGMKIKRLIKTGVMSESSIRAVQFRSRTRKLNGRMVEEPLDATIIGIDLADEAGIRGAGIRQVLEEPPVLEDVEEEKDMEWEELTTEDLAEHRQDILDAYVATACEEYDGKLAKLLEEKEALATEKDEAVKERDEAKETAEALQEELDSAKFKLLLAEAAHVGPIAKATYAKLCEEAKEEGDIEGIVVAARKAALEDVEAETGKAKGKVIVEEAADPTEPSSKDLNPELAKALRLAA